MTKKTKDILRSLFFFVLAVFFVFWFVSGLSSRERSEIIDSFFKADGLWVVLSVLVSALSVYIRALRWQLLIKPLGYKTKSSTVFFSIASAYLTNLAVPRLGEVVRSTMLSTKYKIPFDKTLGTIITERVVDLLLFVLIFFVSFLLEYSVFSDYLFADFSFDFAKYTGFLLVLCLVCLVSAAAFFIFRKKIKESLVYKKVKDFVIGIVQGMKTIIRLEKPFLFIFYSFLIWFLWIFGTWIVFHAMTECAGLNMEQAMTVTVLGAIGVMITPGGIGLYPSVFAEALHVYGVQKAVGYALGWISWLVSQVCPVLFGPIGFLIFANKNKKENDVRKNREQNT